jgi:hypothetical protein
MTTSATGVLCLAFILLAACDSKSSSAAPPATAPASPASAPAGRANSNLAKVRAAEVSVLFVGNSHTSVHDIPALVGQMLHFGHPEKKYCAQFIPVAFLEDVSRDHTCRAEVEQRPWKFIVMQAQKESRSGQFKYSTAEGIEMAKLAKERGCEPVFYAEWGLRDVSGHGKRIEQVYLEMADESGARVAPVGRAWDLALAANPKLPLYADDGNHETATGAFLTACVLYGRLTGESPAPLADFDYPIVEKSDRKLLADVAAKALDSLNRETKTK